MINVGVGGSNIVPYTMARLTEGVSSSQIKRVVTECGLESEGIDIRLLEHISPT